MPKSKGISDAKKLKIAKVAKKSFQILCDLPNNPRPECIGGYLVIRCVLTGKILLRLIVGDIADPEKAAKYLEVASRKTWIIWLTEDISTFSRREPESGIWGGGILTPDKCYAVAFSGHNEHGDEAIAVAIVVTASSIFKGANETWLNVITAHSKNTITEPLLDRMIG